MSISFKQLNNKINSIRFNERLVWIAIKSVIQTITGNAPLILTNAVNNSITSLTQYGLCTQAATPTPDAPVDIKCNNGALRMVDDELPSGYKRLLGISFDGNFHYETGEYLTGDDVVTLTLDNLSSSGKNVFGSYNGANNKNFSLYIYGGTNGSYFRFGGQLKRPKYGSTGRRTITFGASGTSGFADDSTVDPEEFVTPANVYIGMLPNSSSPAYTGDIVGSILVGTRLEWIPCESDGGVIGYYERVNGNFIAPTGNGTPVSLGYDTSHLVLHVEGTPEVLTVSGKNLLNTATNITGKYISSGGVITNGDDAQYTDLIPVTAGETYMWSLISNRENGGNNRWHGYSSAGNWVQQIAFKSSGQGLGLPFALTAVIPNGISYVRLSYGINDTESMICVSANQEISWNGFYKSSLGNGIHVDNMSKLTSPYITQGSYGGPCIVCNVEPGKVYTVSHTMTGPTKYIGAFYTEAEDVTDGTKQIEGTYFEVSASTPYLFTAPEGAHYVVISFQKAGPTTYIFDDESVVVTLYDAIDYQPYVEPQTASVPTLLSVGDVKDEVELIHGTLTRRVTACLYDGTQSVGDVYLSTTGGKDTGAIIVYPLATPTTEQITGQNLVTNEGINIVDVTAEVSPVELKVNFSQTKE